MIRRRRRRQARIDVLQYLRLQVLPPRPLLLLRLRRQGRRVAPVARSPATSDPRFRRAGAGGAQGGARPLGVLPLLLPRLVRVFRVVEVAGTPAAGAGVGACVGCCVRGGGGGRLLCLEVLRGG